MLVSRTRINKTILGMVRIFKNALPDYKAPKQELRISRTVFPTGKIIYYPFAGPNH